MGLCELCAQRLRAATLGHARVSSTNTHVMKIPPSSFPYERKRMSVEPSTHHESLVHDLLARVDASYAAGFLSQPAPGDAYAHDLLELPEVGTRAQESESECARRLQH